jgi:putative ABC transport system ATP-binding protein
MIASFINRFLILQPYSHHLQNLMPILSTRELTKVYNSGKNNEFTALHQINLEIEKNTCTVLRGASGSGKTTLLTILGGLSKPTSGEYICMGEKVSHWSEKFLTQFRRQHIGIVFQHFNLIQGFQVALNIALPLIPQKIKPSQIQKRVEEVARQAKIEHKLQNLVDTLSGGELQRVAIARALITQPEILLADEPTSHLDTYNANQVLEIFQQLKSMGKTIILTSHDPHVLNHSLIDKEVFLKDGRVVEA